MLFYCKLTDGFFFITNENDSLVRGGLRGFISMQENLLKAHKILYGDSIENYYKETTI